MELFQGKHVLGYGTCVWAIMYEIHGLNWKRSSKTFMCVLLTSKLVTAFKF